MSTNFFFLMPVNPKEKKEKELKNERAAQPPGKKRSLKG